MLDTLATLAGLILCFILAVIVCAIFHSWPGRP